MSVVKGIYYFLLLNIIEPIFADKILELSKSDFDAATYDKVSLVQFYSPE
jgi:hypothetical protein